MFNKKSLEYGQNRSEIRELFEYGKSLKDKGVNVYDFTLGNPSTKTPDWVTSALLNGALKTDAHAYTSAQGSLVARKVIAKKLSALGSTSFSKENVILTCGAAASLCGVFRSLVSSNQDEIVVLAPYFPEYKVFIESAGAKFVTVGFLGDDFTPDFSALLKAINKNTKAVVINTPNNPSGKVFSADELSKISDILHFKQIELDSTIYLVSDEPYREINFSKTRNQVADFYENTVVCYSFSKSLSLPGERIGYIAVGDKCAYSKDLISVCLGSLRQMGYVCAPSLFQHMLENFEDSFSDFSVYEENKNLLVSALTKYGFTCNDPKGAFYLMLKAPDGNSRKMSERAKKLGLLIVPADSFGAEGFVRIATCVSTKTVKESLPFFETLALSYDL